MAYTFKYQLQEAPVANQNGTGAIGFLINAVFSTDGQNFTPVPGYSRQVYIHYLQVERVMSLPHGTAAQKTAKNAALKDLIRQSVGDIYLPGVLDWGPEGLSNYVLANENASLQAGQVTGYLVGVLSQQYPINFSL
jgi:hypothetical protein